MEMKAALKQNMLEMYHIKGGVKGTGPHSRIRGDVTGICGNATGIYGNATDIYGYVTGIRGDLDECELTAEDRAKGVDIESLSD